MSIKKTTSNPIFLYFLKRFICCFFLLWSCTHYAQQSKIDSLEVQLSKYVKEDTIKVKIQNELAFRLFSKNTERSLELSKASKILSQKLKYIPGEAESFYVEALDHMMLSETEASLAALETALTLFQSLEDQKGISKCYNATGLIYYDKTDYDNAVKFYKKSLVVNEAIKDTSNIATALNNLAATYSRKGDMKAALAMFEETYKIKKALHEKDPMAKALNNIANIYSNSGNYPLALEYLNRSLLVKEELADSLGIYTTFINIGIVYKEQEEYETALTYYNKALSYFERTKNKVGIMSNLNNIGTIYQQSDNYDKAIQSYKASLKIARAIENKDQIAICLNNIGTNQIAQKKYSLALQYYKEAIQISEEIGNKERLCLSYIGASKAYSFLKNYTTGLAYALKADDIAIQTGSLKKQRDIADLLSNIYFSTKKYKLAYTKEKEFKTLSDSIFNKENIQKIARLEYEYAYKNRLDSINRETVKLSKQIETADQSLEVSKRQTLYAIIGILFLVLILGAIVLLTRLRRIKSKNEVILIEQKLLRSQMTPHFIFNSLSVLQGIILNKEYKKSVTYLSKFSRLLRIMLENSREKLVPLEHELKAIDHYLTIQNLGADIPFEYEIKVDEDIIKKTVILIPPMMIQPFVENAVEHAFEKEEKNKNICVHITFKAQHLMCYIIDNGIGIEAPAIKKSDNKKSLATVITKQRLHMLSKSFNVSTNLTITDRKHTGEQGTQVALMLPFKKRNHA